MWYGRVPADDRALHREPGGAIVEDNAGRARDHPGAERLVQALQQRDGHAIAVDRAHADGASGRLGDTPRDLLPARAHVLGREQMGDVGAVANRSERVLER